MYGVLTSFFVGGAGRAFIGFDEGNAFCPPALGLLSVFFTAVFLTAVADPAFGAVALRAVVPYELIPDPTELNFPEMPSRELEQDEEIPTASDVLKKLTITNGRPCPFNQVANPSNGISCVSSCCRNRA